VTVLVGIECADGSVILGGDSYIDLDDYTDLMAAPKVVVHGRIGIGFAGPMRWQAIESVQPSRAQRRNEPALPYLLEALVEPMRLTADKFGVEKHIKDMTGLVAYRGGLYVLGDDWGLYRSRRGYCAVGPGAAWALGSLHESADGQHNARKRAERALETAESLTYCVRRPFEFVRVV
jgi:hypothetical protein